MSSTPVIGDERPRRPAGEQIAEHPQGEGEQALRDPLDQPADGLGEMVIEPHLALEVGEHRLDDEADPCLLELRRRTLTEAMALGGDELDLGEPEHRRQFASPEPLVGKEDRAGLPAGEIDDRLALLPGLGPTSS